MNKIICLAALMLVACQPRKAQSRFSSSPVASSLQQVSLSQNTTSEYIISANGIGKARLGMTLGQLKQIVDRQTKFDLVSPFTSDLNAIAVSKQGLVQYYITFDADSNSEGKFSPGDDALITSLVTSNYIYQTKEGIKVGTPIQEAEDIYGDAVLAYNASGESAEYISFDDYDIDNVRFRASYFKLISDGLGFSGIYPEYPGVTYTTNKYQDDAAIAAIEVACDRDACGQ